MRLIFLSLIPVLAWVAGVTASVPTPGSPPERDPDRPESPLVRKAIIISQVDPREGLNLLIPLAMNGDPDAQAAVGYAYFKGLEPEHRDRCLAALWFDKAARQGEPVSQFNLALAYAGGFGVRRDDELMYLWMATSARNGYRAAVDGLPAFSVSLSENQILELDQRLVSWRAEDQPPAELYLIDQSPESLEAADFLNTGRDGRPYYGECR